MFFLFRLEAGWKPSRHLGTQDRHVPRERADGSCRCPAACQLRNRAAEPQVAMAILQVLLRVPSPFFTLTLGGSIENMGDYLQELAQMWRKWNSCVSVSQMVRLLYRKYDNSVCSLWTFHGTSHCLAGHVTAMP